MDERVMHDVSEAKPIDSRRRVPRWLRRTLLTLAALTIVFGIGVQVVLWTAIPKDIVLSTVQKQFGLRVSAKSVTTGWFGHTTLRDVSVSLPLADKAFLEVPQLDVGHTWLPVLAITRSLTIKSVTLTRPTLTVVQNARGTWNLQEVAQLLGRVGGAKQAQQQQQSAASSEVATLPAIAINDAKVVVVDNQAQTMTVDPVSVSGKPDGALVWRYDLSIPGILAVVGRLAPGGDWSHQVAFDLADATPLLKPWLADGTPAPVSAKGTWQGNAPTGQVVGQLVVEEARLASATMKGVVEIKPDNAGTAVYPKDLTINSGQAGAPPVKVVAGSVVLNSAGIEARQLLVAAAGGHAQLSGQYQLADGAVAASAAWDSLSYPTGTTHSGDATIVLNEAFAPRAWHGQPKISATLHNGGSGGGFQWDISAKVSGQGSSWRDIEWQINAPSLAVKGKRSLSLRDVFATLVTQGDVIKLQQLKIADTQQVAASGQYDRAKQSWWLTLDGRGWPVYANKPDTRIDLNLDIWGDRQMSRVKQLFIRSGQTMIDVVGGYTYGQPKPVDASVYVMQYPSTQPTGGNDLLLVRGELNADAHTVGTLVPLELEMQGHAYGKSLAIGNRFLGDLDVSIKGDMDRDATTFETKQLQALGGHWDLSGWWPADDRAFRLDLSTNDLPLTSAADVPDLSGTLAGKWTFDMRKPTALGLAMSGKMTARDVKYTSYTGTHSAIERFSADTVDFPNVSLSNGILRLDSIHMQQSDGGWIDASASLNLLDTTQATVAFHVADGGWLLKPQGPDLAVRLRGSSEKVDFDAIHGKATGQVDVDVDVDWKSKPVTTSTSQVKFDGRIITLNSMKADVLGGKLLGGGSIDLDHPYQTNATFTMNSLGSGNLAAVVPALSDLRGAYSGQLMLMPARGPQPLEPQEIHLDVTPSVGMYHNVPIDSFRLRGYLGPQRFVLENRPQDLTRLGIAGGTISIWARISRHLGDTAQVQTDIAWDNLDLDTLVRAGKPDSPPRPGKLAGRISIFGDPSNLTSASGNGEALLHKADLADFGPVAAMYGAMHLGQNMRGPTGEGRVQFRLERNQLHILRANYFNKGTELLATGDIKNAWQIPDSPVDVVAFGSMQPLREIKMPLLESLNGTFASLQTSLVTAKIDGPLSAPATHMILFGQLGAGMKQFLLGDINGEVGGSAN
jgi:hypothetical protein